MTELQDLATHLIWMAIGILLGYFLMTKDIISRYFKKLETQDNATSKEENK